MKQERSHSLTASDTLTSHDSISAFKISFKNGLVEGLLYARGRFCRYLLPCQGGTRFCPVGPRGSSPTIPRALRSVLCAGLGELRVTQEGMSNTALFGKASITYLSSGTSFSKILTGQVSLVFCGTLVSTACWKQAWWGKLICGVSINLPSIFFLDQIMELPISWTE